MEQVFSSSTVYSVKTVEIKLIKIMETELEKLKINKKVQELSQNSPTKKGRVGGKKRGAGFKRR